MSVQALPSLPILAVYNGDTEGEPQIGWIIGFTTTKDDSYALFIVKDTAQILERDIREFQVDVEWFTDQHLVPMGGLRP